MSGIEPVYSNSTDSELGYRFSLIFIHRSIVNPVEKKVLYFVH